MKELIQLGRDVLALKDDAFVRVRDSGDAFARGLVMLVAVALIVGLVLAAAGFVGQVTAGPTEKQLEEARQGIQQGLQIAKMFGATPESEEFWTIFEENLEAGFRMGAEIDRVVRETTALPAPIGSLFEALGAFVSYPWARIGSWMFYSLLVLLAAKLLGGTATVQEMLGLTALYSVPHLLDALKFIPCIGFLLGVVAFFWGLVIYVKGTAIANRMSSGRAATAVVLPVAVVFLVAFAGVMLAVILAALGGGAGR